MYDLLWNTVPNCNTSSSADVLLSQVSVPNCNTSSSSLKGQCHDIWTIFLLIRFVLGPTVYMNRQKRLCELFCFRKDIRSQSSKIPYLRSHWLGRNRVCVVNDYFSTCLHSQRLSGHTIFESIELHFLKLLLLVFSFPSKIIYFLSV